MNFIDYSAIPKRMKGELQMQLDLGNITIHLLPLFISTVIIAIVYILSRWSRELTERHYTIFLYFLISAIIAPIFSYDSDSGGFQLWFPIVFASLMLYLATNHSRRHPAKYKASFLGLAAALFQIMQQYGVIPL